MAFYIGQLRKQDGSKTYMTPIEDIEDVIISSPNPFGSATIISDEDSYSDFALSGTFQLGKVYYLRFKIHKVPQYYYSGQTDLSYLYPQADVLNFKLLLKNQSQIDEEKDPPEQIGTFVVPKALSTESDAYASYSFVFTPSKKFDRLVFRLSRTGFDELIDDRNWLIEQLQNFDPAEEKTVQRYTGPSGSKRIDITIKGVRINHGQEVLDNKGQTIETGEDGDVCSLNNILSLSKAEKYWIKMGYQSRPGNLIVVNGEPIRVGRSGIYELNNGTKIESFMIASPNGSENEKIDAFLLDYAYTEIKGGS